MKPVSTVIVRPSLPPELEALEELAYNLRWTWTPSTIELFRMIDPDLWEEVYHNPVQMIGRIDQRRLAVLAADPGFLERLRRESTALREYLADDTWFADAHGDLGDLRIAYFSAEFGLTEALPVYSGGLGILAGDHMKSASDLGVPLTGVGMFYQQGYFTQYLNQDGWQQEDYLANDFYTIPVRPVLNDDGTDLIIHLDYPDGPVAVRIWQVQVGRVPVFLLDTNLDANRPEDRAITGQLYGGDEEMRIRQEMLLGIGGLRALDALGRRPDVCHLNEGYAAFLALERIGRQMAEHGLDFQTARELTSAGNVFTTHTPVPAGHDVFPPAMMERYFTPCAAQLGIPVEELIDLGRLHPGQTGEGFNMTVLALRLSSHRNGVSKLHGEVSRHMWREHWPGLPEDEIPISSITNGIHVNSWLSAVMRDLLERHINPRLHLQPQDQSAWRGVSEIPSAEIWRVHEERRLSLVNFVRRRLRRQLERRGAPNAEMTRCGHALDESTLTIGFARRFATYKRATLILQDPDRLARLLCNPDRPVQIIFAGKAHPHDHWGKELIRDIVHLSKRDDLHGRIVFVADYDMSVARYLVQGCDVWLNTPLRPLEASGTSGMKAMVNGALNLSVLDGWWAEAFEIDGGWAIGRGEEYDDESHQDRVEADALYELLETEVVPLFYEREDGLPRAWIERMKGAMSLLGPRFNTHRMVAEYTEEFYLPSHRRLRDLARDGTEPAQALGQWMAHVKECWEQVRIDDVRADMEKGLRVGDELEVRAHLQLGALDVADVSVQLYHGLVDGSGDITGGETRPMQPLEAGEDGARVFAGSVPCQVSGRRGFTVRVQPHHENLGDGRESRLITWA